MGAGKVSKERDVHSLNLTVFRTKIHVFTPQRAHVKSRLKQPPPLKVYFILYYMSEYVYIPVTGSSYACKAVIAETARHSDPLSAPLEPP